MAKKILVVEDDPAAIRLMSYVLEGEGYEAVCAFNGKEALEKLEAEKPNLILLDIMMPEMDGFAFCAKLRSSPKHQHLPVVLLTAVAKHIQETKYPLNGVMRSEAQEYLEKPIKPEELLKTIAELLE